MKHKTNPLWECLQVLIQHCAVMGILLLIMTAWVPAQADPQIAKRALAATVFLEVADSTGQFLRLGSGFFVDNNLLQLTSTLSRVPPKALQNWLATLRNIR